ncbi:MAG: GSU2403 family nucleotidyltransferase fold protein, partial [Oricola sp.]
DVFIGRADEPETMARVAAIRAENERAKARRKTISALKAGGVPAPSSQLGAVLDAFDDAGLLLKMVLVGTAAYQCYAPLTGHHLPALHLMTQDADFATLSLTIEADEEGEDLETILKRADASFASVPGLDRKSLPSHFRSASGLMVDLLTPQLRRDDANPMPLQKLKAGATPLQYLKWLITDPAHAAVLFSAGVPVLVPQPARYAIHKLIVAQKRTADRPKRDKDLAQASALIAVLHRTDPYALEDARDAAFAEGKDGWETPIRRSLSEIGLRETFEPA